MRSPTTPLHQKRHINSLHCLGDTWRTGSAAHLSRPLSQSSSSSSSGTKMSCSSSTAAKFLLIWVPTYRKGTTTKAMRMSPKGVLCVCPADDTHTPKKITRDDRVSPPERLGSGSFIRTEKKKNTAVEARLFPAYRLHLKLLASTGPDNTADTPTQHRSPS